jgi:NAD(P)-dependent dehydrogenase (short-subunit alcohol dehydrogenase family)
MFRQAHRAGVQDTIRFAFGSLTFEPGLNRIVTLDPSVGLHHLDAAALRRIREHTIALEQRDGRAVRRRRGRKRATGIRARRPDDVARWILSLADPASGWVTGQIIAANGGLGLV